MTPVHMWRSFCLSLIVAVTVAACGNAQEPAKHALEGVQSAVAAVAAPAQKYLPEQFAVLQTKASDLAALYDKRDFNQVLAQAPPLLNEAQALGAVAAAKKNQIMRTLSAQWPALSASLPDSLAAIQDRIDTLAKNKKLPAGVDLSAAKVAIANALTLWSKAQEAFAAGDMETAVSAAREVKARADAAALALKLSLPAAAPVRG